MVPWMVEYIQHSKRHYSRSLEHQPIQMRGISTRFWSNSIENGQAHDALGLLYPGWRVARNLTSN